MNTMGQAVSCPRGLSIRAKARPRHLSLLSITARPAAYGDRVDSSHPARACSTRGCKPSSWSRRDDRVTPARCGCHTRARANEWRRSASACGRWPVCRSARGESLPSRRVEESFLQCDGDGFRRYADPLKDAQRQRRIATSTAAMHLDICVPARVVNAPCRIRQTGPAHVANDA